VACARVAEGLVRCVFREENPSGLSITRRLREISLEGAVEQFDTNLLWT